MPDLYQLLEKGLPVYVTNHSQGTILLEFKRPGIKSMPYEARIPPISDHPINIAKYVPYPILKEDSTTLFTWLSKGLLVLHDPEIVKKKYEVEPELEAAVDEVVSKANNRKGFVTKDLGFTVAPGSAEQANAVFGKDIDPVERAISGKPAPVPVNIVEEIHPRIKQMVGSLSDDASLQHETLAHLRVMSRDQLNETSLGFLINKCKAFPSIVKWAKGALAKRKGEEAPDDT